MPVRIDQLYYEVNLQTEGYLKGIEEAKKEGLKFADFLKNHPLAVGAAVAAILTEIGRRAVEMSEEVNSAFRRAGSSVPGLEKDFGRLRDLVKELSLETGRSQVELAGFVEQIAKGGIQSAAGIESVLRASTLAAEATGDDLGSIVGDLSQVLNVFQLSAGESEEKLGRLFAVAGNRSSLSQLLAVLATAGPIAQRTGASFDEVSGALTALYSAGFTARQALGRLNQEDTRAGIQKIAALTTGATDGLERMRQKAEEAGNSFEASGAKIRARFSAVMIELGERIAPVFLSVAQGWINIIDEMTGRSEQLRRAAAAQRDVFDVIQIGAFVTRLKAGTDEAKRSYERLGEALAVLGEKALQGKAGLEALTPEQLRLLDEGAANAIEVLGQKLGSQFVGRVQALRAQIATQLSQDLTTAAGSVKPFTIPVAFDVDKASLAEVQRQLRDATTRRGEVEDGGAEAQSLDAFIAKLKDRQTALENAARAAAEKLQGVRNEVAQIAAAATLTGLDDLALKLEEFRQKAVAAKLPTAELEAAIALLNQQRADLAKDEDLQGFVDSIASAGEFLDSVNFKLNEVGRRLAQERALRDQITDGTQEAAAADQRIATLEAQQAKLLQRIAELSERGADATERSEKAAFNLGKWLEENLDKIESVARGAIGLAQALGLASDNAAALLQNVVSVGSSLPAALSGDPFAIGQALGGLSGIISGLFGGGPSPEEIENQKIRKENTEAVKKLTAVFGEFGLEITGRSFSQGEKATQALIDVDADRRFRRTGPKGSRIDLQDSDLRQAINAALSGTGLGVDLAELKAFAETLGITLNTSSTTEFLASLKKLDQALKATELTRFVDSFSGQIDALSARFEFFDITDPLDQLDALLAILKDVPRTVTVTNPDGTTRQVEVGQGSPAIQQALGNLDIRNRADREQFEKNLEDLFDRLISGQVSAAELGGLTPQQFLDQLLQLRELLRNADAADQGAGGETSGFVVSREITEVTGSRLLGLWLEANDYLARIASATESLAGGGVPALPPLGSTPAAGGAVPFGGPLVYAIDSVGLTIPITATLGPGEDPAALGQRVADATIDALERRLGQTAQRKQYIFGDLTLGGKA